MKSLPHNAKEDFERCWVFRKTHSKFSSIPIDQTHEQNNELVKGSGGAVGLTENPMSLRRWMVAGPEQARLLTEFESQYMEEDALHKQHEQGISAQELFKKQSNSLYDTTTSMGNPFKDGCSELLALDSCNCATENVVETVQNIKHIGILQYQQYVNDVVKTRIISINQPIKKIKKNSLPLLKWQKLASLKSDFNLFSHLFIANKFRVGRFLLT